MPVSFISETVFDWETKSKKAAEINELMGEPGFWDAQEKAQVLVTQLRQINVGLKPVNELLAGADDLTAMLELAEEDDSGETEEEIRQSISELQQQFGEVELQAMMSRPEDAFSAYVQVQAGEGGTDASDWAAMLLRMYQRWAEEHAFETELLEISEAEEAGIRSATLAIRGPYVYGQLKGETGNHRLIRISPFDAAGRRQTSFAAVDVVPELADDFEVDIDWDKDVREDIFRSSGAGGQHVNKTSSAIRLTHLASNVVVQCQNERSQHKNRAAARKVLIAKLYQIESDRREKEDAAKRGQKSRIGFGGETIRSYVIHPEAYVKDNRSNYKTGTPLPVLDGKLDPFIEAYLRWSLGHQDA